MHAGYMQMLAGVRAYERVGVRALSTSVSGVAEIRARLQVRALLLQTPHTRGGPMQDTGRCRWPVHVPDYCHI